MWWFTLSSLHGIGTSTRCWMPLCWWCWLWWGSVMRPPFHPPIYPMNEETDSNTHLTPAYTIEFDPTKASYPLMIQLTSNTSSSAESRVPSPRHGWAFIRTRAIPGDWGHAQGRGHDDASRGFWNDFVPFQRQMEGCVVTHMQSYGLLV